MMFKDTRLEPVWEKVRQEIRITPEEALSLYGTSDLLGLGKIANSIKEKRTGDRATFVVNRQINPTNLCVLSCKFCDFASKKGRPNAYALSIKEILSKCSEDLREVHIVGGLHHEWSFEDYLAIVREIHAHFPMIQIKAYTAVEIDYFAKREKCSVKEILIRLKEAGLVCLPGGGAEVFSERVRKALFPFKIGAPRWLEIHRTAHELGIRSNSTLLYGHMETLQERVEHMNKLRALQDETGGFLSFIPLAYQTGKTNIIQRPASAVDDLKTMAVSRIFLDNFDHIKSYWVTLGEETASLALAFGADDLDGTVMEERIMHAADAPSPVGMAKERLERLIRSAGRVPVERNALYNTVEGGFETRPYLVPA
ncbi:MAG: aminofutalosine synthase MqnE [Elusimicrobia bacterium RIFCSPLOWO2_01_FULL_60_11]|nr:MAG: aminofutalosine synthase MqnE [Elusimicrobia bacterium RIFCSPLOWO2_01_FULL_60_11]